jgi:TfoX/Sxy family transcriptional regulator of competence genes
MAYDEKLAERIRLELARQPGVVEKKMFGGVAYLVQGNMACGVHKNNLIVRLGAARLEEFISRPNVRPFDLTGRPMNNWIMVEPAGCSSDDDLKAWVKLGVDYALSLPAK